MNSSSSRDSFLDNVRQALNAGKRAGQAAEMEPRGHLGEAASDTDDHTARFCQQFIKTGGASFLVTDEVGAVARVLEILQSKSSGKILLGQAPLLDRLQLMLRLRATGASVTAVNELAPESTREVFFGADIGITGAEYLIAESGTLVLMAQANEPRSLSLLPPVHIAMAAETQILPDLFDLFGAHEWRPGGKLPSCVSLITGPSKTGDIELRLVTGVHGPGEIHVVIVRK